jgi:hypothetical protein
MHETIIEARKLEKIFPCMPMKFWRSLDLPDPENPRCFA